MAISLPTISNYKRFFIQSGQTLKEVKADYGLIPKSNPYPILPNAKAPYKNEWPDENGDEEYVTNLYYEAYEMDVQFYTRATGATAETDVRTAMRNFFSFIQQGEFYIYDEYTAIGRQKVRYSGFSEDMFQVRGEGSNKVARLIFTIKFKVNDPTTFMKYDSTTNKIIVL